MTLIYRVTDRWNVTATN